MIYFTADYHLGHENIIKYCKRPFKSLEEMEKTIIDNHNTIVSKEDTVFHIGDFSLYNDYHKYLQQLNGYIYLLSGNHDRKIPKIKTATMSICGKNIFMVHEPRKRHKDFHINLVGHVHDKWRIKKENGTILFNVGVDVNNFKPITFEEILVVIKKEK